MLAKSARTMVLGLLLTAVAAVSASGAADNPPHAEHLRLWLDAANADSLTAEDGRVAAWKDSAGGSRKAVQEHAKKRPRYVADAMNGHAVLRFDGEAWLEVPRIRGEEGDVMAFVVSRRSAGQASDRQWQRLLSCWDGSTKNDRTLPSWQLPAGERGSGESYGPTIDKVVRGGAAMGPLAIGANRQHRSGHFRGDIAEILVYDTSFSSGEPVHAIVDYLSEKWGAEISREDMGWTRAGLLGETPERVNDKWPLSDQQNREGWEPYEPLTDEFEGETLDTDKWMPKHMHWTGRQPAFFNPENVEVSDGKLHLTMRRQEVPEELRDRGYHDYSSACVHAREKVKYGYFEVKADPMDSAGSSSFWFRAPGRDVITEIDVYEIGGRAPGFERLVNMNLHVVDRTGDERKHWSCGGKWHAPWDLAADYHVYALEWTPERIKYYVDGVVVRSVPNTHWKDPLYMIFDSETMPDWFGMPEDEDLPSTYHVEYVRAWKKK